LVQRCGFNRLGARRGAPGASGAFIHFEALRRRSANNEFSKKGCPMTMFLPQGQSGQLARGIDAGQVERIIRDHGTVIAPVGVSGRVKPLICGICVICG
jgi:hypothetical protein